MRHRLILLALTMLLAGCGYFNSLYNANRRFAVAEQARREGDRITAAREYREAIDRAAVSYRKYPDGRWADDALLLLGRARFALEEYAPAAEAMRTLLAQSSDASMRALGHAYLGAALFALDDRDAAGVHLDSAAAALPGDSDDGAFVRLWRARASFDAGRRDAAWADLLTAVANRRTARAAAFEGIRQSVELRDSARTYAFMERLAGTRDEEATQRVDTLLLRIGSEWSPGIALGSSASLAAADWPPAVRDAIALTRARLALDAGRPDVAFDLTMGVANAVNGGIGSRARVMAAEISLARAATVDDLDDVRALLLPAYDNQDALALIRRVRAAQILIDAGDDPERSLSRFAAAELLRDELDAPLLARRVFLDFAALEPPNVWVGKAALAAHQITPDDDTRAALDRLAGNVYVRAARGGAYSSPDIDSAEERLAYGIEGLRADAMAEAVSRDVAVGRAITVLDSTRTAVRNDSIRIACGSLIDSLSIAGIRADSTRTACLRGDSARVRFVLTVDTVMLRDSTERAGGLPRGALPDTLPADTTLVRDTARMPDSAVR